MSNRNPRERLQRARVDLLLAHPFFGNLAMYLELTEVKASWCPRFASDGRHLFYDPEFIGGLSDPEVVYCVGHSVMHLALAHAARRVGREKKLWDLATDFAVDAILLAPKAAGGEGMVGPKGSSYRSEFKEMAAEEIYRRLLESKRRKPELDHHLDVGSSGGGSSTGGSQRAAPREAPPKDGELETQDERAELGGESVGDHSVAEGDEGASTAPGGADGASTSEGAVEGAADGGQGAESGQGPESPGRPSWASEPAIEQGAEETWTRRAIEAATTSKLRGTLPGSLSRALEKLLEAKVPWQQVLAEFIHAFFKNDYRWMPPNRRFVSSGILLPSARGEQLRMVVAIDTSGSISEVLLTTFASELQGILVGVPEFWIEVFGCDAAICFRQTLETGDLLGLPSFGGGGGTDFRPVFSAVEAEALAPEVLLYMTDGIGQFPEKEPEYPVLWLMPEGSQVQVPFGRTLIMDP
ncbi:MAG: hypothetical protein HY791_35010 [Deltaproteobacteria bacterium]|nr:hypothetical protein [Deltaproteobacteria bacterium]